MEINKIDGLGGTKHIQRSDKSPVVNKSSLSPKKDEVIISGESSKLYPYQGVSRIDYTSAERSKRIEILREQVRKGSYYVSSDKISEKIFDRVRGSK
jgi:anti-sigma28 factor (negative regulator of flagellin synthesis)